MSDLQYDADGGTAHDDPSPRRASAADRGAANVAVTLDSALKERIRTVLEQQSSTEAELRKLLEDGRACSLILGAELRRAEQRLGELASDPTSSLAEIAAVYRDANELAPDLDELHVLIARLEGRARELRASWLSTA